MAIRKRGQYLVIDFSCYLPDGRKVRCVESTGLTDNEKNRKATQAKDRAIKYEMSHGRFEYLRFFPTGSKAKYFRSSRSALTFGEWWPQWIEEKSLSPNTRRAWQSHYKCHIAPCFAHVRLVSIGEHDVLLWRKDLQGKGLKETSINTYVKRFCECLLKAHKRGLISEYPCDDVKRLLEVAANIDPFTFEELRHLLDYLEHKKPEWHDLMVFWTRTGLRVGELIVLKWDHIDWFNKKCMIQQGWCQANGSERAPKTGRRDVDLRPQVIEVLKRQRARTSLVGNYVWLDHKGRPWKDWSIREKWKYMLKLAGIKYRPLKQIRHTFATLHIAAGESISWVSNMLGHTTVEMTLRKYNRFVPNLTRDDGSAYEKVMSEARKCNIFVTPKDNLLK